ncbi:MAG: hypothetical protein ACPGQL_05905 [Thermoplasmatota archaeon]
MKALLTGASNPHGRAIAEALLSAGHDVRLFGGEPGDLDGLEGLGGQVRWHPGQLEVGGSIEPVLSQREVLIHAANLDVLHQKVKDKHAAAVRIERGTLYTRYGAEREMVDLFVHVAPAGGDKVWGQVQEQATAHAKAARGVEVTVVNAAADPAATAKAVMDAVGKGRLYGTPPGKTVGVTA